MHVGFIVSVLFLCKNYGMSDYMERLTLCGFSVSGALAICEEFMRDLGEETLEAYVSMVEEGNDVDRVQS